ncbi:hypothetical protein [Mammaliicoccus sciuri]|uniref:hypothetical protein n=1 Tax=Mammaliicoccus sciuri TaxID=1296 RepID=UPI003F545AB4
MSNEQNTNNDNDLSRFFTKENNVEEEIKNDKEEKENTVSDDSSSPKQTRPELFKSYSEIQNLENYFKESHEYLTEIFNKLGNGEISSSLDYQQRDDLIKKLDDFQEEATQKFQAAMLQLSEDVTNVKRLKVKSNVNTDKLKSLVYGSPTFRSSYNTKSNIFKDPTK